MAKALSKDSQPLRDIRSAALGALPSRPLGHYRSLAMTEACDHGKLGIALGEAVRGVQSGALDGLVKEAVARFEAMTPEQKRAMKAAQRESFVRGQTTPCSHGRLDWEQCGDCRASSYDDDITPADLEAIRASVRDEIDSTEWERAGGPAW